VLWKVLGELRWPPIYYYTSINWVLQVRNESNGGDREVSLSINVGNDNEFDSSQHNRHNWTEVADADGHDALVPSTSGGFVILLSRRWGRNRGRRLLNERQIFDELVRRFGTSKVVLYPGRTEDGPSRDPPPVRHLDMSSARRLFAAARLIVGVHGGAFYNIVMAPTNCTIAEVMPLIESDRHRFVPPGLAHTIVWRMSAALGHFYWRLYVNTSSPHGDVTLPVERLRTVLDNL
jgi:Glycosyltransferase 61